METTDKIGYEFARKPGVKLIYTRHKDMSVRCHDPITNNEVYAEFIGLLYDYGDEGNFREFFFRNQDHLDQTVEFLKTKESITIKTENSYHTEFSGPLGETIRLRAGRRLF